MLIYILSAMIAAILADLQHYISPSKEPITTLSDIPSIKALYICLNCLLQGLIAWRAFVDTSYVDSKKEQPSSKQSGDSH